ncbi:hypothetical protein LJC14_01520 [Treponema sp. OttesenSCG-928-L16]|nr:hypothetical protein [Treponema sp. OttesenSCG-928-L16]
MTKRHVRLFFFFVLTAAILAPLSAQEGGGESDPGGSLPIESDWSGTMSLYTRGDQTFTISLGPIIPLFFTGHSGILDKKVKVGGTGSLAYTYFLSSRFFVGGEIGGMFASTLGKNMLYIVPMGVKGGIQFVAGRFEFPLSLMIGMAPQKELDSGYFGFFMKPQASVFWRFNPDWSFGLNAGWWWVPQWTSNKSENAQGHFLELTLSARYHF